MTTNIIISIFHEYVISNYKDLAYFFIPVWLRFPVNTCTWINLEGLRHILVLSPLPPSSSCIASFHIVLYTVNYPSPITPFSPSLKAHELEQN